MLAEASGKLESVRRVEGPAQEVARLARETDSLQSEVESGEYKLDVMSQGGLRLLADVNEELTALEGRRWGKGAHGLYGYV